MAKVNIKSEKITPFGGIYYARLFMRFHLTKSSTALFRWQVHLPLHHNQWLGQWREERYRNIQQAWGDRARLRPSQQWFRMEASAMLLLEREHRVHDTDSLLHEFLLIFHKNCVIRIHQLIAYIKSQEVCLPLYHRMRQMGKDGKKMVAEFVYRHAVWQTFFWIDLFFRGFWISIPNGERGVVS